VLAYLWGSWPRQRRHGVGTGWLVLVSVCDQPGASSSPSEWSLPDLDGSRSAQVIVGVHGSLTSLAALRIAVQEARDRSAVLLAVIAWSPVGGELAYRRAPCPPLLRVWRENARQQLVTAFDEALGGYPRGVEIRSLVARGEAGRVLVHVAAGIAELLVVGSGRRQPLGRRWQGPTARYCLAHADGPVLITPPPELLDADRLIRRHWIVKTARQP
jgi:nucleotide-binding universal stress UspA family protein